MRTALLWAFRNKAARENANPNAFRRGADVSRDRADATRLALLRNFVLELPEQGGAAVARMFRAAPPSRHPHDWATQEGQKVNESIPDTYIDPHVFATQTHGKYNIERNNYTYICIYIHIYQCVAFVVS